MRNLQNVNDALSLEKVSSLPLMQHLVSTFLDPEFLSHLKKKYEGYKIVVVHDGVLKTCGLSFPKEPSSKADGNHVSQFFNSHGLSTASWNIKEFLNEKEELHASAKFIDSISNYFSNFFSNAEKKAVFVFGSGTVTDLCKHAIFNLKSNDTANFDTKFVCFPTALTVTAFTSHFSVLDYGGAKRTKPSLMPHEVFWITDVLQNAPKNLNKAGYGDLLARFVAYGDWYLAYEFGVAKRYDELAFRLMEPFSVFLKSVASEFQQNTLSTKSIDMMSECLSMAGIAMSVSGETTPLSGFEHVISHGLDFLNLQKGNAMPLHGEQVALGTLISAKCFHEFIHAPQPLLREFTFLDTARLEKIFRTLLKQGLELAKCATEENIETQFTEIWKEYSKKNELWLLQKEKREQILEKLPEIKMYLQKLVLPFSEIENIFQLSQMPFTPEDLNPSETAEKLRWAVRFSPFVRSRASLADILFWLNLDPALVGAV